MDADAHVNQVNWRNIAITLIEPTEKPSLFVSYRTLFFAGIGLLATVAIATYLVLTQSYPNLPHELSTPLLVAFHVLCPPSLLSALFIDAEIGTSGFYLVWFFVALLNAGLYALLWAAISRPLRRNW